MLKYVLLPVLVLMGWTLSAQTFTIEGTILDDQGKALPGATVELNYPWGDLVTAEISNANGFFKLKNVEAGGYQIKISFLGFETLGREIVIKDQNVTLDPVSMQTGAVDLEGVDVKAKLPLATQKDDTTQFNANAFKVMKDADAGDLINKIPTVTSENGTLKAQGENVGRVLVDGKPFFGEDPNTALKALPAEVIEKIQIFDAQSEQSQFTGFSDGNTTKTINIVTKKDTRQGQFGKVFGGYGYEDKYQVGGNMNLFDNDTRISFIGMSNNINIQNFSTEDILGVTGSSGRRGRWRGRGGSSDFLVDAQGGIATTHAFGVNYSDKWGKKTQITASYFFNNSENVNKTFLVRNFINSEETSDVYQENSNSNSKNTNHKFNARLQVELDSMNSIIFRPRLSFQGNNGTSLTEGMTTYGQDIASTTLNSFSSDLEALDFNSELLWRHKMKKEGRTFSIELNSGYNPQKGDNNLLSNSFFNLTGVEENLDQSSSLDANKWNVSADIEYTEPLDETNQLSVSYEVSYQQEDSEKETYDFDMGTGAYSALNEDLTNIFSNDYTTHKPGIGYRWRKSNDLFFMTRLNAQYATLNNQQEFPYEAITNNSFFNVLPFAMLRYNITKEKGLRIFYRSNTDLPSVTQLQDVLDNTNPVQLKIGNQNLKQAVSHRVFLRYNHNNVEKASTFFAYLSGSLSNDYIANAIYTADSDNPVAAEYNLQRGAQLSRPVNLDGYREFRSFISYGFPISIIKCNLTFDGGYTFNRTPGLIDDAVNYADNNAVNVGASLTSNINEKIDFSLGFRPSYNYVTNSLSASPNTEYLILNTNLRFNWIVFDGFVFRTNLVNSKYSGLEESLNQNIWLWNIAVGKKLFKNERGEISLAVNDLLKQNQSISRNVTETYIEDVQTNALQQFVMLSFTYNFRNFRLKK
ncbi:MAG: TonB-dependent receptor [Saprospiraceae bacterium]|nr:TonB-dependent receptor [Saprospiraceae bacterium]